MIQPGAGFVASDSHATLKRKHLSLVGTNDQMFFATGISFAIIIFVN